MKKISLVFPVYNVAGCVRESLLSALNQTYEAMEYIIVDDRGSDNSMEIVREIISTHPRRNAVRIVTHECNKGIGAARNTGVREATGDYVMFVDSDDIVHSDAAETLIKQADDGCDMIVGSYRRVTTQMGEGREDIFHIKDETIEGTDAIVRAYFHDRKWTEQCWGKLFLLQFLRDNDLHCIEGNNHEDTPFMFECCLHLGKVRLVSDVIYDWMERDGSTTSRLREKNLIDWLSGFVYMRSIVSKEKGRAEVYVSLINYLNNFRLNRIWLLQKDRVAMEKDRKESMLREFAVPLLSVGEIVRYRMSVYDRLKHCVFLPPYAVRLILLKILSMTQKA